MRSEEEIKEIEYYLDEIIINRNILEKRLDLYETSDSDRVNYLQYAIDEYMELFR